MVLPKSLKKFEDKIKDFSDERINGDGYWVWLKNEYADFWFDPQNPTRQLHEQTIKGILSRFRSVRNITDADLDKFPHLIP